MNGDGREVAFPKQSIELGRTTNGLDEDTDLRKDDYEYLSRGNEFESTDLVELERVEEIVELSVLGSLVESNKVLLQSVKRKFLLVVDVDFERLQFASISRRLAELKERWRTVCINFLQVGRISFESVAENIITCLW